MHILNIVQYNWPPVYDEPHRPSIMLNKRLTKHPLDGFIFKIDPRGSRNTSPIRVILTVGGPLGNKRGPLGHIAETLASWFAEIISFPDFLFGALKNDEEVEGVLSYEMQAEVKARF